ncbi:uncharacterized protein ISCGN_026125 [Ixodes scapularis]
MHLRRPHAMIVVLVSLWAASLSGAQAPTNGAAGGPLWFGYTVRTGNADVRFDDIANLAPNNGRSTRYSTAITHGNALSRVEVALGTAQGGAGYYESAAAAAAASSPGAGGTHGFPYGTVVYPGSQGVLVGIPRRQLTLGRAGLLEAQGPPFRFVGQVDHSVGDGEDFLSRPDAQLPAHVLRRRVFRRRFRGRRVFPGGDPQASGASFDEGGQTVQPVPVAVLPEGPEPAAGTISVPESGVVPSVSKPSGPPAQPTELKAGTQIAPAKAPAPRDVEEPGEDVEDDDSDYAQSTPSPAVLEQSTNPESNGRKTTTTPLAVVSSALDTSQSQDTSSVVKNHVQTPLVLRAGRGQYDFRGYAENNRHPQGTVDGGDPHDWTTSRKFRHNFRVS